MNNVTWGEHSDILQLLLMRLVPTTLAGTNRSVSFSVCLHKFMCFFWAPMKEEVEVMTNSKGPCLEYKVWRGYDSLMAP